jgi:hypothetical protein
MEVSGSRTNFAEVINRLTAKVDEALKIIVAAPEWNAPEEAAQYFNEASWALKWGVLPEAQAAADSAWALGKHDLDCANLRVRAYMSEVAAEVGRCETYEGGYTPGYNADGVALGPPFSDAYVQSKIKQMATEHPWVTSYNIESYGADKFINYIYPEKPPEPKNIDRTLHALNLYDESSRNPPEGGAKGDAKRGNSEWRDLGIEDLVAASQVLQNFNFYPQSQKPVAAKLAELRALARAVSERICQSPSVHNGYFVGDRVVGYDELHQLSERPNIFCCQVKWGCFWQERPEDDIALYRQLMSSPVFCYIHTAFWFPGKDELPTPRLVAWNEGDRKRIPGIWNDFIEELNNSTNVLLRMEAKAVRFADAANDKEMAATFDDFFDTFLENRCAMMMNNVDVLYMNWHADDLVRAKTPDLYPNEVRTKLGKRYQTECLPKLAEKDKECRKLVAGRQNNAEFEKQKDYLLASTPFDFQKFVKLFQFGFTDYSKAQALELQPILALYKSNLVAQLADTPPAQSGRVRTGIGQVGLVELHVNRILNPPNNSPASQHPAQLTTTVVGAKQPIAPSVFTNSPEIVSNVLTIDNFLEIPVGNLQSKDQNSAFGGAIITAHHWVEGKLLLDLKYGEFIYKPDAIYQPSYPAIAILDPKMGHWDVIGCAAVDFQAENRLYHHSTLCRGEIFTCNGNQIKKYDSTARKWEILKISDGNNYELFTVNDRLYAANGNSVFEIINGGSGTRLLASARRQPPASALDTQKLGTPTLFEGPGHSLRISAAIKIFTWTGNDWRADAAAPSATSPPLIFGDGVLFVSLGTYYMMFGASPSAFFTDVVLPSADEPARISRLATASDTVEVCLEQKLRPGNGPGFSRPGAATPQSPRPTWEMPPNLSLANPPATLRQSDLYLLADHSKSQDIINEQQHLIVGRKVIAKGGYHAELLCFSHDMRLPQKLCLKFDNPNGCPPAGGSPAWMFAGDDYLFFGLERSPMGFAPEPTPTEDGYKPGVWMLPVSEIDPIIAGQKQIQLDQKVREIEAAKQAKKNLLAKYPRNHNGGLDPEEKENALDDPAFIESELDVIDANDNGRLDPEELVYFDANHNKILDPKEQDGIEIAQHLFAAKLLKKFDANGKGFLDRSEFRDFSSQSGMAGYSQVFAAGNRGDQVDVGQIESFLTQQLRSSLRQRRRPGAANLSQFGVDPNRPVAFNAKQFFKAAVETYWQNSASGTQGPPK